LLMVMLLGLWLKRQENFGVALRESLEKVYACAAEQCGRASYIRGKILFI